jgi:nicotinic acid mononucleotide adenylyltransferase
LLTLANLIVVTRPGHEISTVQVGAEVARSVVDLRGESGSKDGSAPDLRGVFLTDAVMLEVSASEIRRAARENDSEKLDRLVPPEVAEYIRKYRLYRNTNNA